jgi:transposase
MNRRQAIPPQQKYTIKQFQAEFPNDDACLEYLMQKRWPGAVALCGGCKAKRKHHRVTGRTCYACDHCGNHLFPLAGTVFHKSTTSLTTWFYVIKLMTSTRVGVSAKQIQRETGVTYKTAWRMMKQVRILMAEKMQLSGPIEMDEAEFGGSDSNKPSHLRGGAKTLVFGIVERRGRVLTAVVPNAQKETLFPIVKESVLPKAMIYTDGAPVYEQLRWMGQSHKHKAVNHEKGYVDGYAHTNTIDGFWSLVKRGIQGVYYQVGPAYLQSYLNEYAFRYNRRKLMRPMFRMLLDRTTTQVCPAAREKRALTAGQ